MQKRDRLKVIATRGEGASDYIVDAQVGFLMRVAMQRHTSIFMTAMVEELTQTQFAVLVKLREVGPCSQNHLGRLVYLDAATIKGVVDRLILRDFLATGNDPLDRRRRAVSLTPKGAEVIEQAVRIAVDITAATLKPLTQDEQRTLVRLLKKLG